MALPLLPIATVVRILGPKAVRAAKSLHKRLVAQKKTNVSQERFLSEKARTQMRVEKSDAVKKRIASGPKASPEFKGKTDPTIKKYEPRNMKEAEKFVLQGKKLKAEERKLKEMDIKELRALNERLIRKAIREKRKQK